MEARIKKSRKPKKRKATKRRRRKVVLKRAKSRTSAEGSEMSKKSLVTMVEFTNRSFETSTVYVCTSPEAALQQAVSALLQEEGFRGLRDMTEAEADAFILHVRQQDYSQALSIWSASQNRRASTGQPWVSVEIWSALIHDGIENSVILDATIKAWQARFATQAAARA